MKKIIMLSMAAGPDGALERGRSYRVPADVPTKQAKDLIAGGYAREDDKAKKEAAAKKAAAAARKAAKEKAAEEAAAAEQKAAEEAAAAEEEAQVADKSTEPIETATGKAVAETAAKK
jgi:peptidoglycan DL-endopeptidase CwlO